MRHENSNIAVPCGKCPACLKRRTSAWSFRLMQEGKRASSSLFVTLTYNAEHLPFTRNRFRTLDKKHVQDFMKRLRKRSTETVRYYAVGEYGTDNKRPHYHLILFNAKINDIELAWSIPHPSNRDEQGNPTRVPIGHIHYGDVTGASIGYTLKYMCKPPWKRQHVNDDRLPEFSLMSKGLGSNYLTDQMIAWHYADINERMYCHIEDGKKISMPRYYKDKLYTKEERIHIGDHLIRKQWHAEELEERAGTKISERDKVELDRASFKQMHDSAIKNRTL